MNTVVNILVPENRRGETPFDVRGVQCLGVLEASFRDLYRLWKNHMTVSLVAVDGGYVIRGALRQDTGIRGGIRYQEVGIVLKAEHSNLTRVFKKSDSALSACRKLGLQVVSVEL